MQTTVQIKYELISAAQELSETSDEILSSLCGLSLQELEELKSNSKPISATLSEKIIYAFEKNGCYFSFIDGVCQTVHLFSYADLKPKDDTPLELSKIYAVDARSFSRNAAVLNQNRAKEDEVDWLHLPLFFLCGHSIELSLKSYILKAANNHNAILKPQKGRMVKTHDLVWLLNQCRRLGCESVIDISDLDYHHIEALSAIHASYSNRFREGQSPPESLTREALLTITQKICRYSEPPAFQRDRFFKNERGPLVLTFEVLARPTPKKPPAPK